jgi:hypothetical protein
MKASFVIPTDGVYKIYLTPEFEKDARQQQLRIYRNRVRLLATESTFMSIWRGRLDANDLIEADGEFDVRLVVVEELTQPGDVNRHYAPVQESPDAREADSGNDDAGTPVTPV